MTIDDLKNNNEFKTAGFRFGCLNGREKNSQNDIPSLSSSFLRQESIIAQSGRSMVEMLGTLAIIGVLSIGGITGYSYAMDKYRANEIINDIMLRATDVIAQFESDPTREVNLSEWPTKTAGDSFIALDNESLGINIIVRSERLCQMIFDGIINKASVKMAIGDGAYTWYDAPANDVCRDGVNFMTIYANGTIIWEDEENTETKTCPADAYMPEECNNDNDFYVDMDDPCAVKKHNESCPNRELSNNSSVKKCNLSDWYANGNSCPPETETTTTTTLAPEQSDVEAVQCEWTDWINNDHPSDNSDGGDVETVPSFICKKEYIQDIECRSATEPYLPWETLGQKAQCNTDVGFVCKNSDQFGNELFGLCYDYEIRVFCCRPTQ